MRDIIRAESYYLLKNVRYYVFLAVIFVLRILSAVPNFTWLSTTTDFIFYIFIVILVLEFSHKDFNLGTMKNYVGSGVSLENVYFGKLLTCMIAVVILSVVNIALRDVVDIILGNGSVDIVRQLISLLISIEKNCILFFICSLITSSVFAVIIGIAYSIVLGFVCALIKNPVTEAISPFLLDNINNAEKFTFDVMWHLLVTTLVVAIIVYLGAKLYSKREVK